MGRVSRAGRAGHAPRAGARGGRARVRDGTRGTGARPRHSRSPSHRSPSAPGARPPRGVRPRTRRGSRPEPEPVTESAPEVVEAPEPQPAPPVAAEVKAEPAKTEPEPVREQPSAPEAVAPEVVAGPKAPVVDSTPKAKETPAPEPVVETQPTQEGPLAVPAARISVDKAEPVKEETQGDTGAMQETEAEKPAAEKPAEPPKPVEPPKPAPARPAREGPGPARVGADLGRDHVRRSPPGLTALRKRGLTGVPVTPGSVAMLEKLKDFRGRESPWRPGPPRG